MPRGKKGRRSNGRTSPYSSRRSQTTCPVRVAIAVSQNTAETDVNGYTLQSDLQEEIRTSIRNSDAVDGNHQDQLSLLIFSGAGTGGHPSTAAAVSIYESNPTTEASPIKMKPVPVYVDADYSRENKMALVNVVAQHLNHNNSSSAQYKYFAYLDSEDQSWKAQIEAAIIKHHH